MKGNHLFSFVHRGARVLVSLTLAVLLAVAAQAQRATGTISGRATDKEGAVLPGPA